MQFRVTTREPVSKVSLFAYSIQVARIKIAAFKMGTEELVIEQALLNKYKKGLKQMCFDLVTKLQPQQITESEYLFLFTDEESDKIASFITYGDGNTIHGSEILVQALTKKTKVT
jgi:hypothetical protein